MGCTWGTGEGVTLCHDSRLSHYCGSSGDVVQAGHLDIGREEHRLAGSAAPGPSKWHTGLLDCMSDCSVCICGAFCYPCLGCQVANAMDEFCLCGGSVAMRTLYRTRYNIPGSILGDYYSVLCCPMCSLCQLKRDIDYRKEQRTFW
uniref:Placenta associated 8 n=1 Tax=Meleagris gallopavo TaxID=9103 RepID=A0A803XYZ7_MELGA